MERANKTGTASGLSGTACRKERTDEASAGGHALVPFAPTRYSADSSSRISSCPAPDIRPTVPFLTQLIATAQGVPQTRTYRRADPDRVIAAYAETLQLQGAARGSDSA
jgi:hypothetical protein